MFPVILRIGPLTLHTYGLMIAVGFLVSLWFAVREAKRVSIPSERIMDIGFYCILSGIVGARLVYVLTNWSYFAGRPLDVVKVWEGGLVFYGGVIFAIPTALWYAQSKGLPVWKATDAWAPSLAIGHAIGRIGCFCAGCCHGSPAQGLPWAVTFTHPESLAIRGVPLHPTQLYESGAELLNFLFLYLFLRPRKTFDGQLFWAYIANYAVIRFWIEYVRGDIERGFLMPGVSTSQGISIAMLAVAAGFLLYLGKKPKAG
ncbi:MAG: prolipoprotein diacylglyceryl transferase [Thermodesulfovibrionales bacterium]